MNEKTIEEKRLILQQRLPNIQESELYRLSDEQLNFILYPTEEHCFLSACPGSGKTEVVGLKAAFEIAGHEDKHSGIAVLSFTNNAADEISKRVHKYSKHSSDLYPHYIGTIDSWLHRYILHPFGHLVHGYIGKGGDKSYGLLDSDRKYDFIMNKDSYTFKAYIKKDGKSIPIGANIYDFDYLGSLFHHSKDYSKDNVTAEEDEKFKSVKKTLLKHGFCTYSDAEYIEFQILNNRALILNAFAKRFPVVIIDECQDLSANQLSVLHLLVKSEVKLLLVGDINQSIYEFRNVDINSFSRFLKLYKIKELQLTRNYRSEQNIVDVSLKLIRGGSMDIIGDDNKHPNNIQVWYYNNISDLKDKFITEIESQGLNIQNSVILARAKSTIAKIVSTNNTRDFNKLENLAYSLALWSKENRSSNELQTAFKLAGKVLSELFYIHPYNAQQYYAPSGVSHVEWRNVIRKYLDSSVSLYTTSITWSNLSKKVRNSFGNNVFLLPESISKHNRPTKAIIKKIIAPSGKAKQLLSETIIIDNSSDNIKVTTIHDVKGETYDAIMLVSSEDKHSKGGHYSHWLSSDEKDKEFIRFAYVASSRPKYLLIWAIPEKDRVNREPDLFNQNVDETLLDWLD